MPVKYLLVALCGAYIYINITKYMIDIQYLALCLLACYKDLCLILLNRFFGNFLKCKFPIRWDYSVGLYNKSLNGFIV